MAAKFVCPYCGKTHEPDGIAFNGVDNNASCCGEVGHCLPADDDLVAEIVAIALTPWSH